jgi:hypothetical protein
MWLAGLRGAMAYALALKSTFDFEKGPIMLIATLIYAFLSILGVGSFMTPILDKIGVTRDNTTSSKQDAIIKTINNHVIHAMPPQQHYDVSEDELAGRTRSEGGQSLRTNNFCLRFKRNFSWYEQRYFAPLFIRNM